jgi:hypothetical protein
MHLKHRISALNFCGYYMYHLINILKPCILPNIKYLCVPYGSRSKQRLLPQTALTGWSL